MTTEYGRPRDAGAAQVFDAVSRSGFARRLGLKRFAGASKLMRFCACLPQESSMRGAHWIAGRGR
jgi:hypothetical protein